MTEEQSVLNQVLDAGEKQQESEEKQKPEEKVEKAEEQAEETKKEEPKPEEPKNEEKPAEEKKPEQRKQPERSHRSRAAENVVLVGKKPTMSYVLAVVTQFSDGMNDVHLKARGRSISRAVDVAEVVRNRFIQGAKTSVLIGTEEIIDENNNKINVSTIDIGLNKQA